MKFSARVAIGMRETCLHHFRVVWGCNGEQLTSVKQIKFTMEAG